MEDIKTLQCDSADCLCNSLYWDQPQQALTKPQVANEFWRNSNTATMPRSPYQVSSLAEYENSPEMVTKDVVFNQYPATFVANAIKQPDVSADQEKSYFVGMNDIHEVPFTSENQYLAPVFGEHDHLLFNTQNQHTLLQENPWTNDYQSPISSAGIRVNKRNEESKENVEIVEEEKFICDLCKRSFSARGYLIQHQRRQHSNIKIRCTVQSCPKVLHSEKAYAKHMAFHRGEFVLHKCPSCPKEYRYRYDLDRHFIKQHDPDQAKNCSECGKSYVRGDQLQRHMMIHKRNKTGTTSSSSSSKSRDRSRSKTFLQQTNL